MTLIIMHWIRVKRFGRTLKKKNNEFQIQQLINRDFKIMLRPCLDKQFTFVFKDRCCSCTLSDHRIICKHIKIRSKVCFVETRSYRKFDDATFKNGLKNENLSPVFESIDAERAWDLFTVISSPICEKGLALQINSQHGSMRLILKCVVIANIGLELARSTQLKRHTRLFDDFVKLVRGQ